MNLDLNFIYQTLSKVKPATNAPVVKISTDSRENLAGCVFFALKGENFDGHAFVDAALKNGAIAAVVENNYASDSDKLIRVDNTLAALGQLAHAWRMAINPKLFGITGSSGKTTIKEMLTGILKGYVGEQAVLATQGNFNNEIGLPLTLLRLKPEHQYAVIEMGMNHFGELARLTRIANPDIALVNNAQRVHIGCGFDGVADIAKAKSEIYQGLLPTGVGIYPAESEYAEVFMKAIPVEKKLGFGLNKGDVQADEIVLEPLASKFVVYFGSETKEIHLPVAGKHNVSNALAAISMALSAKVSLDTCRGALQNFKNIKGRLQESTLKSGARIIDDTYNANPDAMKAAIDVLIQFPSPRILVMGDLGELGDTAAELHSEVGAYAKTQGIEHFFGLGQLTQNATRAFGENAEHFDSLQDLVERTVPFLDKKVTVLVKGSRFMKMERVVEQLLVEKRS